MSDSEEMNYVRPEKVVHYGSLEDAERARLEVFLQTTDNIDVDHDGLNQNIKLKTNSSETGTSASEGIFCFDCYYFGIFTSLIYSDSS